MDETLEIAQQLLVQLRDYLRKMDISCYGPFWYREGYWILNFEGYGVDVDITHGPYIHVDLETVEIILYEREGGKHSRLYLNLHEPDCFDRLVTAIKHAGYGS